MDREQDRRTGGPAVPEDFWARLLCACKNQQCPDDPSQGLSQCWVNSRRTSIVRHLRRGLYGGGRPFWMGYLPAHQVRLCVPDEVFQPL